MYNYSEILTPLTPSLLRYAISLAKSFVFANRTKRRIDCIMLLVQATADAGEDNAQEIGNHHRSD